MLQTTTITRKWQMTIPRGIREILGLTDPGRFVIEVVDKKEKLIRIKKRPTFLTLAGSLPAKNKDGQELEVEKVREIMENAYKRE